MLSFCNEKLQQENITVSYESVVLIFNIGYSRKIHRHYLIWFCSPFLKAALFKTADCNWSESMKTNETKIKGNNSNKKLSWKIQNFIKILTKTLTAEQKFKKLKRKQIKIIHFFFNTQQFTTKTSKDTLSCPTRWYHYRPPLCESSSLWAWHRCHHLPGLQTQWNWQSQGTLVYPQTWLICPSSAVFHQWVIMSYLRWHLCSYWGRMGRVTLTFIRSKKIHKKKVHTLDTQNIQSIFPSIFNTFSKDKTIKYSQCWILDSVFTYMPNTKKNKGSSVKVTKKYAHRIQKQIFPCQFY